MTCERQSFLTDAFCACFRAATATTTATAAAAAAVVVVVVVLLLLVLLLLLLPDSLPLIYLWKPFDDTLLLFERNLGGGGGGGGGIELAINLKCLFSNFSLRSVSPSLVRVRPNGAERERKKTWVRQL